MEGPRALAIAFVATATAACQLALVFTREGATVAAGLDAAMDVVSADASPPPCVPRDAGPEMILVDEPPRGFWIDSIEVTRGQYAAFAAQCPDALGLPRPCKAKTSHALAATAACSSEPDRESYPAGCLDWCDAFAFCRWAGKRLCEENEWIAACSNDGTRFPYGPDFRSRSDGGCNTAPSDGPESLSQFSGCEGGSPGLFNMSGNVAEWIACDRSSCSAYGGDWRSGPNLVSCYSLMPREVMTREETIGFRCCRDP